MMLNSLRRRCARMTAKWRRSYVKRREIAAVFASIPREAVILEIGGGYNPRFVKGAEHPNVYHLDHASTDDLRTKYSADPNVAEHVHRIQPIDFVFNGAPIETLVPPALRFDVIYGSHVLEHQVDLIGHLQSIEKLLAPGGRVVHVVPDLRTCFDALRYPTVTSDVLLVHLNPAPTHRGKQIFDNLARHLNINHGYLMCDADFTDAGPLLPPSEALASLQAAGQPGQHYLDLHAWTFTPESFRLLMIELRMLGLTKLVPRSVSPTYGNQFCAVLERSEADPASLPATTLDALQRERLALAIGLRFKG